MSVNFKKFHHSAEIQNFLQTHLSLGKSTIQDVSEFLRGIGLKDIHLIDNEKYKNTIYPPEFEHTIVSWAPARPTWLILENVWHMQFEFNSGILAKVSAKRVSISL